MLFALALLALPQVPSTRTALDVEWNHEARAAVLTIEHARPGSRYALLGEHAGTQRLLGLVTTDPNGHAGLALRHASRSPLMRIAVSALPVPGPGSPFPLPGANALAGTLLPTFRDSFEGATLSSAWSVHNPAFMAHSVSGGALHLQPMTGVPFWFNDGEGGLIYRTVAGDFTVTATVRVESPTQPGQPPAAEWRLGGILVRDPSSAPGARNSVHVAFGAGSNAIPVAVEDKTTSSSTSTFLLTPVANTAGQLRIRRVGSQFTLYHRPPAAGGSWLLVRAFDRPDLPSTVQVGLMSYSASSPASVLTHVDEIRISLD